MTRPEKATPFWLPKPADEFKFRPVKSTRLITVWPNNLPIRAADVEMISVFVARQREGYLPR